MVAVFDQIADKAGNGVLGLYVRLVADGIRQIGLCAVAPDRAAVGFGGVALFFQLVEVAADGLLSHVIVQGKLADQHALVGAELGKYFIFAFDRQHEQHSLLMIKTT